MTVSGIGGTLYLDSSTVTLLLKRLEDAGLVRRDRDLDDERKVHVTLTNVGQDLETRAAHISACIFEKPGLEVSVLWHLRTEISDLVEDCALPQKPNYGPAAAVLQYRKSRHDERRV